jgi:peroxiredoxin
MLITDRHIAGFDLIEIIAELELPFKKYKALKPLKTGNHVNNIQLKKENINKHLFLSGSETHGSVLLRNLAGKPLVISFYSAQWQEHGLSHLQELNNLQNEIKALGANLLIVTPDAASKELEKTIWDNSLTLNFYFDADNAIAQKFKVYSEADPAWNKYPGIDVNVPLLATYVLDADNQVVFDHVDKSLQSPVLPGGILQAIHAANRYIERKSA